MTRNGEESRVSGCIHDLQEAESYLDLGTDRGKVGRIARSVGLYRILAARDGLRLASRLWLFLIIASDSSVHGQQDEMGTLHSLLGHESRSSLSLPGTS